MGNSYDSCVFRFLYNRLCRNSARRDWVLQHMTPCFDDNEVHCGMLLHLLCRKKCPHMFPLKFGYRKVVIFDRLRRKDRTLFGTIETLLTKGSFETIDRVFPYNRLDRLTKKLYNRDDPSIRDDYTETRFSIPYHLITYSNLHTIVILS